MYGIENMRFVQSHDLDYASVEDIDDYDGDQVLAQIYCNRHKKYEWHWVEKELLK